MAKSSYRPRPVLRHILLAVVVAAAPMQCRGSEEPSLQRSETPGDALYSLAQQFRENGQQDAYVQTLRFIIDRFPSSRRAITAQAELDDMK